MAGASEELPELFQEILKGGPIPPVDPEDLKRAWGYYWEAQKKAKGSVAIGFAVLEAVCSPGANISAIWNRHSMLSMLLLNGHLLDPWRHGEELDDAVFRIAATFPMEGMKRGVTYSGWPFDVDAFLKHLPKKIGGS
jgi:hypothetical protein